MAKVILISGQQGSGKSTLSLMLQEYFDEFDVEVHALKFADALYEMHEALREVAEKYDIPFEPKEGRLLQLLGTEWGRVVKGHDVWVNSAKARISQLSNPNAVVLIDDCRFQNEFHAFPDALRVRLKAPEEVRKARTEGWREDTKHVSETDLNGCEGEFDLVIDTSIYDENRVFVKVLNAFTERYESSK